jgi:serine/threonine protein kinase
MMSPTEFDSRVRVLVTKLDLARPADRPALLDRERAVAPEVAAEAERLLRLLDEHYERLSEEGVTAEARAAALSDLSRAEPLLASILGQRLNETEVRLALPRGGPSAMDVASPAAGYELLEELGRGGMGVVYRARQVKLNRVVALKMILAGPHADADDLARFRGEAEAIARLSHPNIVQVYEVGDCDGQPFFSLEYCDGGSLAKKLNGTPLPSRDAAALVEALARGVQAAHDSKVVHRDLKPANVLLTTPPVSESFENKAHADGRALEGIPKITDFGLARRLDTPGVTRSGAIVGTPSYMAPEQARGEKTGQAADVWSLGAILYESLTGRPPFTAATVPVALKCLEKEPTRRYASAADLADDLGRYLAGEPIRARPTGAAERAWKWARRRPVVAGLLALLVLSAGIVVGAWASEARQRREAASQRDRAREALALIRQSLDRTVKEVVENRRLQDQGMFELRRELLHPLLPLYERLAELGSDDPELELDRGRAYTSLGEIRIALGQLTAAVSALGEAKTILARLVADQPDNHRATQVLARCNYSLARALKDRGENEQALSILDQGIEAFAAVARRYPTDREYAISLARLYQQRGQLFVRLGKGQQSLTDFRLGVDVCSEMLKYHPADEQGLRQLAYACTNLAGKVHGKEREAVLQQALRVVDALQSASSSFEAKFCAGQVLMTQGSHQREVKLPRQAIATLGKALVEFQGARMLDPTLPLLRYRMGQCLLTLGIALYDVGRRDEAQEQLHLALGEFDEIRSHPEVGPRVFNAIGLACYNLSVMIESIQPSQEAVDWLTKCIDCMQGATKRFPDEPSHREGLAVAYASRACVRVTLSQFWKAIQDMDHAAELGWKPKNFRQHLLVVTRRSHMAQAGSQQMNTSLPLLRVGWSDEAVAEAIDLPRRQGVSSVCVYNCARALSLASKHAPSPKKAERLQFQAVRLLVQAHRMGHFTNSRHEKECRHDADLNAIRNRDDFRAFVASLPPAKPKP